MGVLIVRLTSGVFPDFYKNAPDVRVGRGVAWGWVDECGAGWVARSGGCGCYAGSWFSWWGQVSGGVLASVGGDYR